MSSAKDVGLRLAALTALRDLVDAEVAILRAEMSAALLAVQEVTGADRIAVTLPGEDGPERVASVSLVKEAEGIDIDPARFLAWAQENAPDEIVRAVKEPFRRALLSHLVVAGDSVVDKRTGMVVEFATPRPAPAPSGRFMLRFEGGPDGYGRAAIAAAWREGRLSNIAAALPGGDH